MTEGFRSCFDRGSSGDDDPNRFLFPSRPLLAPLAIHSCLLEYTFSLAVSHHASSSSVSSLIIIVISFAFCFCCLVIILDERERDLHHPATAAA